MPEHGIPIELETPRGVFEFNLFDQDAYVRLTEFSINSAVRAAVEPNARRDGSMLPAAFRNGATAVLKGDIRTATLEQRADMLDELRAHAVSILRADGIIRWTPTGKDTRRLVVRCLEDPTDSGGNGPLKSFQHMFVARTPHSESDTEHVQDLSSLSSSGDGDEHSYPHGFPMTFGPGLAPGAAIVTNAGNADTYPVLRITGPFTDWVRVVNATTNDELELTLDIPSGQHVLIDMAAESVLMNGDVDQPRPGSIDPLSAVFWPLVEGANEIRVFAEGFDTGHGVAVYWRDGFA